MTAIPDFNKNELWVIEKSLEERYRRKADVELAETELRLNPHSSELTPCPTVYWSDQGCHFLVVKVADGRYRGQFFYRVHQQYGTGREEYTDLTECVVTLLQVQADYAVRHANEQEGDTEN